MVDAAEFIKVDIPSEEKDEQLTEGDNMDLLSRFKIIIFNMRDETLLVMVDMYNAGKLSPLTRLALEAVEAMAED